MVLNKTASTAWAGWVIFTATMLLMIGTFNVIEGLIALFNDERVLITPERLITVDLTGWGWTLLIFGLVMIAAGIGLFTARTWARITAIIIVALHAVVQITWLGAYPIWSLLMIALDVVVLFALTARWTDARTDLSPYDTPSSRTGQHTAVS